MFRQVHFIYKECLVGFLILQCFIAIPVVNANSVDPDQTPQSAASDLSVNCLKMYSLWDARYKLIKT